MNVFALKATHRKLVAAVIKADVLELPAWRFDGKAVTTPEEVASALSIPLSEATARLQIKDVYGASGASASAYGVGTVRNRTTISQRASALASRRRRRKKEKQT